MKRGHRAIRKAALLTEEDLGLINNYIRKKLEITAIS